ncbi:hypothetical protein JW905_17180 [bacterium]|nr:hypothetical protein [candidate division CSSED10-310 bacterium]
MRLYTVLSIVLLVTLLNPLTGRCETTGKSFDLGKIWVDENGVPHILSLSEYMNGVLQGRITAPQTKTLLARTFPGVGQLTDDHKGKLIEMLSGLTPGNPYMLSALTPEQIAAVTAPDKAPATILEGTVYKIKRLDGSMFMDQSEDFIWLFPYTPEFFHHLKVNDVAAAKSKFQAEVLTKLRECAAEGEASCESGLKVLEIGGVLPPGTKAAEIYRTIETAYQDRGEFDAVNLGTAVTQAATGADTMKIQPNEYGLFRVESIKPGYWILFYSQRILDYLYILRIEPGSTTKANIFHPFDQHPYLELR